MNISEFLSPESIRADLSANGKKQVLQKLARAGAKASGADQRRIFDILLERERLGSTGVGSGVAIPHGRLAGIDRPYGVFARLAQPVSFEAVDDKPVDLTFMLLVPDEAGPHHLRALSRVSRLLRNVDVCARLRSAVSADAMAHILLESGKGRSV